MTIENKNIDFLYSDLTADLYDLYKKSSYLAIDTEAMGLIHGRDRLCLVQICNEFKRTSCIKIELNTSSSPHLKALLEDEKITKIFSHKKLSVTAGNDSSPLTKKQLERVELLDRLGIKYVKIGIFDSNLLLSLIHI